MRTTRWIRFARRHRAASWPALAAAVAAGAWFGAGCAKKVPESPTEVVALRQATLPATPGDAAWKKAPVHTAPLVLQDMVEPLQLETTTPQVRVQAVTDGESVAFRLSWTDSTRDDTPSTSRFIDACAVQLPLAIGSDLPAPQMGETGARVEITYWSASWQAEVNGRGDSIQAIYPNAAVDHYPFEAPTLEPGGEAQEEMARRYAPARAATDKPRHPPGQPVQDLLAEGPGTITPAPETRSAGAGQWAKNTWEVVVVRPLPAGLRGQTRAQVAFAVWNGHYDEVGSRKMRSVWIPLSLEAGS